MSGAVPRDAIGRACGAGRTRGGARGALHWGCRRWQAGQSSGASRMTFRGVRRRQTRGSPAPLPGKTFRLLHAEAMGVSVREGKHGFSAVGCVRLSESPQCANRAVLHPGRRPAAQRQAGQLDPRVSVSEPGGPRQPASFSADVPPLAKNHSQVRRGKRHATVGCFPIPSCGGGKVLAHPSADIVTVCQCELSQRVVRLRCRLEQHNRVLWRPRENDVPCPVFHPLKVPPGKVLFRLGVPETRCKLQQAHVDMRSPSRHRLVCSVKQVSRDAGALVHSHFFSSSLHGTRMASGGFQPFGLSTHFPL